MSYADLAIACRHPLLAAHDLLRRRPFWLLGPRRRRPLSGRCSSRSRAAQELLFDEGGYQVARDVPADRLIWVVVLGGSRGTYDAEGTIVVLDFVSGKVYESVDWLS